MGFNQKILLLFMVCVASLMLSHVVQIEAFKNRIGIKVVDVMPATSSIESLVVTNRREVYVSGLFQAGTDISEVQELIRSVYGVRELTGNWNIKPNDPPPPPEENFKVEDLIDSLNVLGEQIKFDSGNDKIKISSLSVLLEVEDAFEEFSDLSIKVIGHTDCNGSELVNLQLSRDRAIEVISRLSIRPELGITLSPEGVGCQQRVDFSNTPEGDERNRRISFELQQ